MSNHPSRTAHLTAVESYLEEEFPGHVEETEDNVYIISHQGISHRVVLEPTFLKQCPDYTHALRQTDLADYIREVRSQPRRFLVIWQEHSTHIRSTPL
jgi:hypothetical protein